MILTIDSNPKNSLYYIGSLILKLLKENGEYDYLDLFNQIKKNNDYITIKLFTFSLDWLYLISAVEFDAKAGVIRCI